MAAKGTYNREVDEQERLILEEAAAHDEEIAEEAFDEVSVAAEEPDVEPEADKAITAAGPDADEGEGDDEAKGAKKAPKAARRRTLPQTMAAAMLMATPLFGWGATQAVSFAAETMMPGSAADLTARYLTLSSTTSVSFTDISKRVHVDIPQGALIAIADNAEYEADGSNLRFQDKTQDARVTLSVDDQYELVSVTIDGVEAVREGDSTFVIPADTTGTVSVVINERPQAEPEDAGVWEDVSGDAGPSDGGSSASSGGTIQTIIYQTDDTSSSSGSSGAGSSSSSQSGSSGSTSSSSSGGSQAATSSSTPAYTGGGTSHSSSSTVTTSTVSGSSSTATTTQVAAADNGTGGMTDEELALGKEIFAAYNSWRSSQGLSTTTWSGECATMARDCAKGCAGRGSLVHRLGIPSGMQLCRSDILQYASWRIDASEAVDNWANSSGHAAQMRCGSAAKAACGVYKDGEIWWFAIVYDFNGTNVG